MKALLLLTAFLVAYTFGRIVVAETRAAPQHEIPEAMSSDLHEPPRSALLFAVCDEPVRIYFTTSDGRSVQYRPEKSTLEVPEAFDALSKARLFDVLNLKGDFCPPDGSPKKHIQGTTDL